MRTIEFRGKRIDNNEWVFGYLYKLPLPNGEVYMILTQDNTHLDNSLEPEYHLAFTLWVDLFVVNPNTISQFTSLYDKSHNKIYEGDILTVQGIDEKLEVRFVRGVFAFLWNGDLDNEFPTNSPTHEWAEVVGNIHDNPNLIKKGEKYGNRCTSRRC